MSKPAYSNTPSLAAIVLTKNEERDLPACLESLRGVASEIFVVDSGSTDRTLEIAGSYRAEVLTHPFLNQAAQFNWALDNIQSGAEWILRIDADERLSEELRQELQGYLTGLPNQVKGLLLPRRIHFLGRPIRHGASYPVWLLRVWKRGCGRSEDTWMDEHIVLSQGQVLKLQGDLIHEIPKSLSEWTRKHDGYAARECKQILAPAADEPLRTSRQAKLKRLLKNRLYLRLPAFYRAFFYWFYRYFFRLGFLDGKEGLIYHFLQGFWYRFLVDAKLYEFEKRGCEEIGLAGVAGSPEGEHDHSPDLMKP